MFSDSVVEAREKLRGEFLAWIIYATGQATGEPRKSGKPGQVGCGIRLEGGAPT